MNIEKIKMLQIIKNLEKNADIFNDALTKVEGYNQDFNVEVHARVLDNSEVRFKIINDGNQISVNEMKSRFKNASDKFSMYHYDEELYGIFRVSNSTKPMLHAR